MSRQHTGQKKKEKKGIRTNNIYGFNINILNMAMVKMLQNMEPISEMEKKYHTVEAVLNLTGKSWKQANRYPNTHIPDRSLLTFLTW